MAEDGTVRLNLGSGAQRIPGYTSVDLIHGSNVYPLSGWADASVDEVYASHVLEHFPMRQVDAVLREWARVLKPGGIIRVAVPDARWIAEQLLSPEPHPQAFGFLLGGQTDPTDHHQSAFDRDSLSQRLLAAGFERVEPFEAEYADCSRSPCSLNLQAVRSAETERPPRVAACMTTGRLTFADNAMCVAQTLPAMGIPLVPVQSAFPWTVGISQSIKLALMRFDPDYILTLDGDTIFAAEHVAHLLALAETHRAFDAIFAVQKKREEEAAMVFKAGAAPGDTAVFGEGYFDGELSPADAGHFGLTIIRRSVFERMPRPWFMSTPDHNGEWGPGALHADVRFWAQLKASGMAAAQANGVIVGHQELRIGYAAPDGKTLWQSMTEWKTDGFPRPTREMLDRAAEAAPAALKETTHGGG